MQRETYRSGDNARVGEQQTVTVKEGRREGGTSERTVTRFKQCAHDQSVMCTLGARDGDRERVRRKE